MTNYEALLDIQKRKLSKAIAHLAYSYKKIQNLTPNFDVLDEESLETWESFAARFARVADMFLMQYLRTQIMSSDPGFSGSMRDFINQGEKLGLLTNANAWMNIRELRNVVAHDYSEEELAYFFQRLKQECPRLLVIRLS